MRYNRSRVVRMQKMKLALILSSLVVVLPSCNRLALHLESWRNVTPKPSGVVLPPAIIQGSQLGENDEPPIGFSKQTQEFVISPMQKATVRNEAVKLKKKRGRSK